MTDEDIVGTVVELEVGPVAHGGHCVARHEGQVVFVRHALPGELVHARVTEQNAKYLRADAVQVLTPSPQRIEAALPVRRTRTVRRLRLPARQHRWSSGG